MKNCPLLLLQTAASSSAAAVLALLVAWVQQPLFDTCSDGLQKYLLGMGVVALVLSRLAKQSIRFRVLQNELAQRALHAACGLCASSCLMLSVFWCSAAVAPQFWTGGCMMGMTPLDGLRDPSHSRAIALTVGLLLLLQCADCLFWWKIGERSASGEHTQILNRYITTHIYICVAIRVWNRWLCRCDRSLCLMSRYTQHAVLCRLTKLGIQYNNVALNGVKFLTAVAPKVLAMHTTASIVVEATGVDGWLSSVIYLEVLHSLNTLVRPLYPFMQYVPYLISMMQKLSLNRPSAKLSLQAIFHVAMIMHCKLSILVAICCEVFCAYVGV